MHELTWGLDVSTDEGKTSAVAINWSTAGEARVVDVRQPLRAADIAPLISEHKESRCAVDVPFGWPDLFVALMAAACRGDAGCSGLGEVADPADRATAHRPVPHRRPPDQDSSATGVFPAARRDRRNVGVGRGTVGLPRCRDRPVRSRGNSVPAALSAWGFGKAKQTWSELQSNFAFLTADEHLFPQFASDDVCDAIVCALVAGARDLELTIGPPADEVAAARKEGWIHVSCEPSGLLVEAE